MQSIEDQDKKSVLRSVRGITSFKPNEIDILYRKFQVIFTLKPWPLCYHVYSALLPWQVCNYHDCVAITTKALILWQHYCYYGNTTVTMTTLLLPWQHCCYHDDITAERQLRRYNTPCIFTMTTDKYSVLMTTKLLYLQIAVFMTTTSLS